MSTSACTAIPSVATPARRAIFPALHSPTRLVGSSPAEGIAYGPNTTMKTASPAIATRLFAAGAHMKGPNRDRALRIWPRSVYRP